jgi:hypothetical protein
MCKCTSEVWSGAWHRAAQGADPLGPSRNDGVNSERLSRALGRRPSFMTEAKDYGFRRAPERLAPFINVHKIMISDEY